MSILVIADSREYGGCEQYLTNLIQELARKHLQCMVVTRDSWFAQRIVAIGIPVHIAPFDDILATSSVVTKLLRPRSIIHAHRWRAVAVAAFVKRRYPNVPVVASIHSLYQPGTRTAQEYNTRSDDTLLAGLQCVDAVVAISKAIRDSLLLWSKCLESRITVIYPGVPFNYLPKRRANRDILGFVGRLSREKGPDLLINAVSALAKDVRLAEASVVLVGDGPMSGHLHDRTAHLGLDRVCVFTGFASDPLTVMSQLCVLIAPSRQEGFGLSIVEAGSVGVPAIASYVGGIPEVIESNVSGLLVNSEDPNELATAMHFALEHKDDMLRMGLAARTRCESLFGIERSVKDHLALYSGLVG